MNMSNVKKIAGISMAPQVFEVLDKMGQDMDRSRSWLIEDMVRKNSGFRNACARQGVILPPRDGRLSTNT